MLLSCCDTIGCNGCQRRSISCSTNTAVTPTTSITALHVTHNLHCLPHHTLPQQPPSLTSQPPPVTSTTTLTSTTTYYLPSPAPQVTSTTAITSTTTLATHHGRRQSATITTLHRPHHHHHALMTTATSSSITTLPHCNQQGTPSLHRATTIAAVVISTSSNRLIYRPHIPD